MRGFLRAVEESRLRDHEEKMAAPALRAAPKTEPQSRGYERNFISGHKQGRMVDRATLDALHVELCRDMSAGKLKKKVVYARAHNVGAHMVQTVLKYIRRGENYGEVRDANALMRGRLGNGN